VLYLSGLAALGVGGVLGYLFAPTDHDDEELDDAADFKRAEREVKRRIQRKWRFRLRRRRKELKQRLGQVERLKTELEQLEFDPFEANQLEATRSAVDTKRRQVQSLQDRCSGVSARIKQTQEQLTQALLKTTDVDLEEFIEQLNHRLVEQEQGRSVRREREGRQYLEVEAENEARKLIIMGVNRYGESHSVDRLRSSIRVDQSDRRDALLKLSPLFEAELGMALEMAPERDQIISIRGADPMKKEASQRILTRMLQGSADEKAFASLRRTVEEGMRRESSACSQRSIDQLGVGEITGERRRLLDRLRYRHSYRQNQWRHAAEVGFLSGMLAWELDLDPRVARRGGLMHDIGKSMTHEVEGGHAVLGAEVARAEDEHPGVASCIGAHHGDEPPLGLEPYLVAAGDAISGARPGARVQGGEHHETLVRDLERIGRNPRKVENAYTVRGGRELRVMLAMEDRNGRRVKVTPQEMETMATEMKSRIEDELTYPGTIDVTVIRRVVAEVTAR